MRTRSFLKGLVALALTPFVARANKAAAPKYRRIFPAYVLVLRSMWYYDENDEIIYGHTDTLVHTNEALKFDSEHILGHSHNGKLTLYRPEARRHPWVQPNGKLMVQYDDTP